MSMKGTVTIRDVAEAAGVSIATVSRALRGLPSVAPATRQKIEDVATRLEYVPDPYAARLSATSAHRIIVAVPLPGQWFYAQVVAGVEAVASEEGFDLQLHVVGDDRQRRRFIGEVLPQQRRIDGAVLVDIPISGPEVRRLIGRGIRLVAVGQHVDGIVSIRIDNRRAAYDATEHLIRIGHRRIALIGGMPSGRSNLSIPGEREEGYRQALVDARISIEDDLIVNGDFSIDGGVDAARELLSMTMPPTAIFALSDEMAVGAIRAAREANLRIPEDVSIVGFDDHDFAAPIGLTTVRQPVVEQGAMAAQALLDAVGGDPWGADQVLDHVFVPRETTPAL